MTVHSARRKRRAVTRQTGSLPMSIIHAVHAGKAGAAHQTLGHRKHGDRTRAADRSQATALLRSQHPLARRAFRNAGPKSVKAGPGFLSFPEIQSIYCSLLLYGFK